MLSIVVDFMIYLIYTVFYFELADDIYSVPVFCTDPYLYVFLLFIVECNKRTFVFNSTTTLASLHHVRFQGELLFLARTGFSLIHVLMSLKSDMDHLFTYFSFLDTLRFRNLRIECSCGDDFQILGIISIKF